MMDLVGYTASYLAHGENHAQEHANHEFGAQYDDVRERYWQEAQDMRNESLMSDEYQEYMQKVYDAGFGEDWQAYEASWKRTLEYAQQLGH